MELLNDANLTKEPDFLIKPIPLFINMFDNFGIIKSKDFVIPRIDLVPSKTDNLDQLLYPCLESRLNNKINKQKNNICILLNKDENNSNRTETKEKTPINNNKLNNDNIYSSNKNFNNCDNNKGNPGILLPNDKIINLIPPKSIVSIFNNTIGNQNNINTNKSLSNDYETINNMILNNINLFSNDPFIQNKNNLFFQNNLINNNQKFPYSQNPFIQQETKGNGEEKKMVSKRRKRNENDNDNGLRRIHTAADYDNILRKIQVHYLSFIINYTNDVIDTLFKDKTIPKFQNLDYQIKKTVNRKSVEGLKSKNIGQILQLRVSPKMKKSDSSVNKVIFETVCNKYPSINDYMNKSYISLFKEYYNNENKIFKVNNQIIQLSERTKTFCDLTKKNGKFTEKMKYVAINYFLNCYKRIKKPNFKTHIIKK